MLAPLLVCWTLLHAAIAVSAQDGSHQEEVPPLDLPDLKPLSSLSFRGPFKENGDIAGFSVTGQATRLTTSPDFLRLLPPIPLAHGSVFSSDRIKASEWVVEVALRVHGSVRTQAGSPRGGRGLGFWYTKTGSPTKGRTSASESSKDGDASVSFFGNSINFDGLGVIFDSAPSAPLLPRSDTAGWRFGADSTNVISALIDDGKTGGQWYDTYKINEAREHGKEAKYLEKVAGECEAAFRNAPGLVWVRVSHFNKEIRIDLDLQPHTTLSQEKRHFTHHCLTVKDVQLPTGYHFGISALASGNTEPDSVDIYAFDAWEVVGKSGEAGKQQPAISGRDGDASPLAGTVNDIDDPAAMLQEVLSSQARMTEAIDAMARRLEGMGSATGGGDSARFSAQLSEVQAALSKLAAGGIPGGSSDNAGAASSALSSQLDKMNADLQGLHVKVDTLTSRTNKNFGTLGNRLGEIFTIANRLAGDASERALIRTAESGLGGQLVTLLMWTGGLGAVAILGLFANNWRKSRAEGGGRGKKMI